MTEGAPFGGVRIPALVGRSQSLFEFEKSLMAHMVCLLRPSVIVELGVCEAVTTTFLCDVLELNGIKGKVFGFDLDEVIEDCRTNNLRVRELEASGAMRLVPGPLPGSLARFLDELDRPVDLALIDALHQYPAVRGELDLLWKRLHPEGYIVVDDYLERTDGVRWAVDAFVRRHAEAMCVPLLGTAPAMAAGVQSKLAILRRRPYVYGHATKFIRYDVPAIKSSLLSVPFIRAAWAAIRPVFRGGTGDE